MNELSLLFGYELYIFDINSIAIYYKSFIFLFGFIRGFNKRKGVSM